MAIDLMMNFCISSKILDITMQGQLFQVDAFKFWQKSWICVSKYDCTVLCLLSVPPSYLWLAFLSPQPNPKDRPTFAGITKRLSNH